MPSCRGSSSRKLPNDAFPQAMTTPTHLEVLFEGGRMPNGLRSASSPRDDSLALQFDKIPDGLWPRSFLRPASPRLMLHRGPAHEADKRPRLLPLIGGYACTQIAAAVEVVHLTPFLILYPDIQHITPTDPAEDKAQTGSPTQAVQPVRHTASWLPSAASTAGFDATIPAISLTLAIDMSGNDGNTRVSAQCMCVRLFETSRSARQKTGDVCKCSNREAGFNRPGERSLAAGLAKLSAACSAPTARPPAPLGTRSARYWRLATHGYLRRRGIPSTDWKPGIRRLRARRSNPLSGVLYRSVRPTPVAVHDAADRGAPHSAL